MACCRAPPRNITDHDTTDNPVSPTYRRHATDGPTGLFVQLLANPDFRQMFADHVYKDLSGVLSPTNAAAIYQSLANTISTGVLDESARWGNLGILDGTWNEMGTPATWDARLNSELGTWFPTRTATMFTAVRDARDVHAPRRRQHGDVHLHDVSEHRPAHAVRQRHGRATAGRSRPARRLP